MANPDISLLGATYSGVSGVTLPKSGGGTATFPWVEGSQAITSNGTVDVTNLAEVVVNVSGGGGGGSASKKQVNFIDYDGTILYSYTAQEANALSALPANPSHTGLTAQGWNWTLAEIKAQLTAMPDGDVWVGQMYITASGNTEIDVSMPEGILSPVMTIAVNGTITVDWGDNTTPDTVTGASLTSRQDVPHSYASPGDYTIVISVTSGSFSFYCSSNYTILRKNLTANANKVYTNCIQNIRLGSGITSIGIYAFCYCFSLTSITIPDSIRSIDSYAFYYCYSLPSVTIPNGVTDIVSSLFMYCYSLASVAIPNGVTFISSSAFNYCYSLTSVTIPNSVTSIGNNSFSSCSTLTSVAIPDGVTSIGANAFQYCRALRNITIPDSVTSFSNYAFYNCESLMSITIPNGATGIGSNVFVGCFVLANITIPGNVTSIGKNAFKSCYGVFEYHLLPTTPPTLETDVFSGIMSDCVIYVPYSADHSILEAYKAATNWSTYASYMQEEPQ